MKSALLALALAAASVSAHAESLIQATASKDTLCHVRWPTLTKLPECRDSAIFGCVDKWIQDKCKVGDVVVWYDHGKGAVGIVYTDSHDHFEKYCSVLDMRVLATGERACRIATMPGAAK